MEKETDKYTRTAISLMGAYEDETKEIFSEKHSELEDKFWQAVDTKNLNKLKFLVNEMSRLVDDVRGGR